MGAMLPLSLLGTNSAAPTTAAGNKDLNNALRALGIPPGADSGSQYGLLSPDPSSQPPQVGGVLGYSPAPDSGGQPPSVPATDVGPGQDWSALPPQSPAPTASNPGAQAGPPGMGPQGGPPAPPSNLPALAPPPQLNWDKRNAVGDILDNLFLGGVIQRERYNQYKAARMDWENQAAYQQAQRTIALANSAQGSPDGPVAAADPSGYLKIREDRISPVTMKGGETRAAGDGSNNYAPVYGYDPTTRRGYTVTPNQFDIGAQQPMQDVSLVPAGTHPHLITTGGGDDSQYGGASAPDAPPMGPPLFGGTSGFPVPPPGAPTVPQGASAPRGLRNNNPGNVMALPGGQQWQGQTGVDPNGYATFDTMANGARASLMNLHSYATKHGINTVQGVVNRWAPARAGNPTGAYAKFVASRLGVGANDKIDLTDPTTLTNTARALFDFENGPKATQQALGSASGQGGAASPGLPPPGYGGPSGAPLVGGGYAGGAPAGPLPTSARSRDVDLTPNAPSGSRPMTPAERQQWGVASGSVASIDAKGDPSIVQAPEFGAKDFAEAVKDVQGSKELENYNKALGFYSTAAQAAQRPGGLPDAQLTDLAAQQFSGGVARKFNADMISNAQGPLGKLKSFVPQLLTGQKYTPAIRQALLTAMHDHAVEQSSAFDRLVDSKNALTQRYGADLGPIAAHLKAPIPGVPTLASIPNGMGGGDSEGGLQPGQIVQGRGGVSYQFLGGDRSNAANWKAVR